MICIKTKISKLPMIYIKTKISKLPMIYIKTKISKLPDTCDDCEYYSTRPHPYKGWTQWCELCMQCLDDDKDEGWIYDGDSRPNNCPLIEVEDV